MQGGMEAPRAIARRGSAVAAGLGLLAAMLAPQGAAAQSSLRHAGDSPLTVAQVSNYWTPQRMANAKPVGLLRARGSAPEVSASEPVAGQPQIRTATSGSSVSFTSFELTDTTSFPNRIQGKVFFSRPGAGNFVCSGTVVDAGNRSTVITAGHCVHAAGSWSTNFAFAPGYRNLNGTGNAPYGVWGASDISAPQPWVDSENLKYDVGAAVIARNASGQALENVVGARGIAFNQSPSQNYRSYGYPAQPTSTRSFDGTRLWACDSSPPISDNPSSASGPNTLGIGCDMTGGSSGGGWVTSPASSGYLNGLNSYKYTSQPNLMYGPYFGSTVQSLYSFAAAEPPGSPRSSGVGNSIPANDANTASRPTCKKARKRVRRRRACRSQRRQEHRRHAHHGNSHRDR
jgi:hypothetical protein